MMINCNGKCSQIKEPRIFGISLYDKGFVRCLTCDVYFAKSKAKLTKKGRLACPCCTGRVRTKTPFRFQKKRVENNELVVLA